MSKKNPLTDLMAEFNTDSEEFLDETPSSKNEDFGALLSQSFSQSAKRFKVGDKVRGKLLNVASEELFVDIGAQKDALVARKDLLDAEGKMPYQAGDSVELFVTLIKKGEIRLSKNASDRNVAEDFQSAKDSGLPIQGKIVEVCNGGVRVNIKGKLAFCPISQIDSKHVENPEEYVGRTFDFKITEVSEGGKNIVVSRRKLLDAERDLGTTSFLSENQDGAIVQGRITRFETFGAFVELAPGVEGLVHISEISPHRISSPAEVLKLGETVSLKLLKREVMNGRAKISLSIKQAAPMTQNEMPKKDDAWSKFSVGQTFTGQVTRKEAYGLFVQIEPGITGLLHKSRTDHHKEFHFEKVRIHDPLEVKILEIRPTERQLSLGLPGEDDSEEWRNYKPQASSSLGTLADRMNAALKKK